MLIATAQLAYPNYLAEVWHVYLVYVAMMFFSYLIICLPTKYVSWFNIWATALGIVVLIVTTILLPAMANELNSGKEIFTSVRCLRTELSDLTLTRDVRSCTTRQAGPRDGRSA